MNQPTIHILHQGQTYCGVFWPHRPLIMAGDVWVPAGVSVKRVRQEYRKRMCDECLTEFDLQKARGIREAI